MPDETRPMTAQALRRELNLERWDRRGVQVRALDPSGKYFNVTAVLAKREELVLRVEPVNDDDEPDA